MLMNLQFAKAQSAPVDSAQTKITITNIRNSNGTVRIGVFYDDPSFQSENSNYLIYISKESMMHDSIVTFHNLPIGKCALSMIDDENDNKQLDYGWLGVPLEGFGFSNYFHKGFSKPKYDQFEIEIVADKVNVINMPVRYIW